MEDNLMPIMIQILELEKNKIQHEKKCMEWRRMKVENEILNEHLDYLLKWQGREFDSKLDISRSLEIIDKSMLIKNQMFELNKNKIEHEKRFVEFHSMKVENVFLKLAIEHLDYMLKFQESGFDSKLEISSEMDNEWKEYMESHILRLENEFLKHENERLAYIHNCDKGTLASKL